MHETPVKEWEFDPKEILASTRKVQGIFHQPVIDKDGELISPKGMRDAVPDFMHLPALHDFHKERPVGLATKVMELSGGRFYFEGVIKATSDCDDVWEKVKTGNYDQVSIFGKRTKYNNQCSLPQNMRSGPCITDGVRLDSISVCDENARNPQTSLEVKKAKTVFDAETIGKQWGRDKEGNFVEIKKATPGVPCRLEATPKEREKCKEDKKKLPCVVKASAHKGKSVDPQLVHDTRAIARRLKDGTEIGMGVEEQRKKDVEAGMKMHKAESAGDSSLMHESTDYAKEKDFGKSKKCACTADAPNTIRKEIEKSTRTQTSTARRLRESDGTTSVNPTHEHQMHQINARPSSRRTHERQVKDSKPEFEKAEDDSYGTIAEDHPITYRKPKIKPAKDNFNPMRERGEQIPKRTKSGYPLRVGKNEPPSSKKTGSSQHTSAPNPAAEARVVQERNLGAEAIKFYEGRAGAKKILSTQLEGKRSGLHRKIGFHKQAIRDPAFRNGDDMEKGTRPKVTEEPLDRQPGTSQKTRKDVRQRGEIAAEDIRINKADEVEKGAAEEAQEDMYEDDDYDHAEPSDTKGQWSKDKDPNGTVKMTKAQDNGKPEEDDEQDEEEDEEEEVEKGTAKDVEHHYGTRKGMQQTRKEATPRTKQKRGNTEYEIRQNLNNLKKGDEEEEVDKAIRFVYADEDDKKTYADYRREEKPGKKKPKEEVEKGIKIGDKPDAKSGRMPVFRNETGKEKRQNYGDRIKKGDEDTASELFDPSTVTKGERMDETDYENDVEYVTKALVPIEEIDTIVKARTEEIYKAYMGQLDEIKKAHDDRIDELSTKIEKMENETIRKGGSVVVIPELMRTEGTSMSNADALARMQAGQ